jgi:N-acetylmuramoyl-L-alanine amidase
VLGWIILAGLHSASAQRLSPLAELPDWKSLDLYQETITRDEFLALLDNIYAPNGAWHGVIEVDETAARVIKSGSPDRWTLQFAASRESARPLRRFWRGKADLLPLPTAQPLKGVRIALDPGHIGGAWAKMEERWFRIGDSKPVTEGDMTLYVAKLIAARLKELGAEVFLTRTKAAPVTSLRPGQLKDTAAKSLADKDESVTPDSLKSESERLFYRVGEIRRRARLVNERIKPDLVLCLHFNAEAWGNENHPTLTDTNHLHFLVTGAFGEKELRYEDQRFNMLQKLLSRSYPEELAVTESLARTMAAATGLPPYQYTSPNVVKVGVSPYIWARNLLANRLFDCPVVYLEPYVMNSREVFARIQAGDYDGRRKFGGVMRPSIYREYADSVVQGLLNYYAAPTP